MKKFIALLMFIFITFFFALYHISFNQNIKTDKETSQNISDSFNQSDNSGEIDNLPDKESPPSNPEQPTDGENTPPSKNAPPFDSNLPPEEPGPPKDNSPAPAQKTVYLTFDDGPSENTDKILDILSNFNVKATFFVNGKNDVASKNRYIKIVNQGHKLGNHTYSHDYSFVYSSVDNFLSDYNKLNAFLISIVGTAPDIMRFPGGSNNHSSWTYSGKNFMSESLIPETDRRGYVYFDWNVTSGDADSSLVPKDIIINNVKKGLGSKNNAVILFHDSKTKTTTVEALPQIIGYLKAKGYEFKILSKNSPSCKLQN